MESNIYRVDNDARSLNAYLSYFTKSVIFGFLLALPYTGFISFVLFGRIDFSTPANFTTLLLILFFKAGAIKIAPSNNPGFYSVK